MSFKLDVFLVGCDIDLWHSVITRWSQHRKVEHCVLSCCLLSVDTLRFLSPRRSCGLGTLKAYQIYVLFKSVRSGFLFPF